MAHGTGWRTVPQWSEGRFRYLETPADGLFYPMNRQRTDRVRAWETLWGEGATIATDVGIDTVREATQASESRQCQNRDLAEDRLFEA
jgi:hypothetical protein